MSGCLIDTAIKDGRGLLSWIAADALADLVAEAHGAGLEIALAGELRAEDLPTLEPWARFWKAWVSAAFVLPRRRSTAGTRGR